MVKQLGWAHKLCGAKSVEISKVGQTVLARFMESQLWHQPSGSVLGGCRKGTSSACFDARHLVSPCVSLVPFKLQPAAGAQREWVWVGESVCVCSLRGTAWCSSSFFHWLNLCWCLQPEVVGTYLPGTGTLGWGAWCRVGTPCSQDNPPECLSTTHGVRDQPVRICTPPTSLDECGFFNSIVFRLLLNSVSDGSKWWWFFILVVILMWLCRGEPCLPMLPSWPAVWGLGS